MNVKIKLAAAVLAAVLAAIVGWVGFHALGTVEACVTAGDRCIRTQSGWSNVDLMRGKRSVVLLEVGIFGGQPKNDNDVIFFTAEEAKRIEQLIRQQPVVQYKFGRAVRVNDTTFAPQNLNVPGMMKNAVYVLDTPALIRCQDLGCLNEIVSVK
jgi:hypothetical protein